MAQTTYTYSLSQDFPGGQINTTALQIAIQESTIAQVLLQIDVSGDVVSITFTNALAAPGKTTLDGNQSHPAGGLIASTPTAQFLDVQQRYMILGTLLNANMNTTSDQPLFILTPRYIIRRITASKPSLSLNLAVGGLYTGPSKGGQLFVPAIQTYLSMTGQHTYQDLTLAAPAQAAVQTKRELYFSLTTPQGVPATMDLLIWGEDLNGLD